MRSTVKKQAGVNRQRWIEAGGRVPRAGGPISQVRLMGYPAVILS